VFDSWRLLASLHNMNIVPGQLRELISYSAESAPQQTYPTPCGTTSRTDFTLSGVVSV
jgi:hypothetical protein